MDTLISVEEALSQLLAVTKPSRVSETALLSCVGRALGCDVFTRLDTPAFDRAMLDGFAVRARDVEGSEVVQPRVLKIVGDALAGTGSVPSVGAGEAVRTMTGARRAPGADAIVRLEWARECLDADGNRIVEIYRSVPRGEAISRQGEGGRSGELLARAGGRIGPLDIGRFGSHGMETAPVHVQPVVGILTIGDELAPPGTPLVPGQVYDSNAGMLASLVAMAGGNPRVFVCAKDDDAALQQALVAALDGCDALITAGGVSVGDRDLTPAALERLGAQRLFWGVWMRPGTPVYACVYEGKPVLCCSGNPFAAWVNAVVFGWPMLERLQGIHAGSRQWVTSARVKNVPTLRRLKHERFLQAELMREGSEWWADLGRSHSSGLLPASDGHSGLVRIEAGSDVQEGDRVDVLFTQM